MLKLLLPVLGVAAVTLAGSFPLARAATGISPEAARETAEEAYVYGFPMVMGYKTMQNVLAASDKVILDKSAGGTVPYLPLNELRRGGTSRQ